MWNLCTNATKQDNWFTLQNTFTVGYGENFFKSALSIVANNTRKYSWGAHVLNVHSATAPALLYLRPSMGSSAFSLVLPCSLASRYPCKAPNKEFNFNVSMIASSLASFAMNKLPLNFAFFAISTRR